MIALLLATALAAPPSSRLTGPEGTLSWDVRVESDVVHIDGRSPRWTVSHTARADLTPLSTRRTSADGAAVTITYGAAETVVTMADREVRHARADLWDGDTLDVRLGQEVAAGHGTVSFAAVDGGSGKVYDFNARTVGVEQCAGTPCTHVDVQLAGLLRLVGPTWSYWYGADGRLLRFEGPAGSFAAGGAP